MLAFAACPVALARNNAEEQLVDAAANAMLQTIANGNQRADIEKVLSEYVSLEHIALFALGKHRRRLKAQQQQTYITLFREMIINALVKHGGRIRGEAFVVTGSRGGIVQGYIRHRQDTRTKLEFRTKDARIADIRVQGFWLAITLRKSYDQLLQQANGDINALLDYLKSGATP